MNTTRRISLETAAGTFFAEIETAEETLHNSIFLSFRPIGFSDIIDVAAIKDAPKYGGSKDIVIQFFGNLSDENPTEEVWINRKEIEEALGSPDTEI